MRCFVRLLFCLRSLKFSFKTSALVFLKFLGVCGLGMDGWYSPCIFDQFSLFVWVVYLSELVKCSHIERYLAAKIGTIFVVFSGRSSSFRLIAVVF
jgi:hypothetical protein